jgi:UDP-N-acetyl-D-mannosaminuronate dehydrogenase
MHSPSDSKIGVIGLGYVGLPLAVEFARVFATVGFDVNSQRIAELKERPRPFDGSGHCRTSGRQKFDLH